MSEENENQSDALTHDSVSEVSEATELSSSTESSPESDTESDTESSTVEMSEKPLPANDRENGRRTIESILRRTRRAYRGPALLEIVLWLIVVFGAFVVTGFAVGWLTGEDGPKFFQIILTVGLGVSGLSGLIALAVFFLRPPELKIVAGDVERSAPEFRNDITSALSFLSQDTSHSGFSESLISEHVSRTAQSMHEACKTGHLAHVLPQRSLLPIVWSFVCTMALLAIPFLADSNRATKLMSMTIDAVEASSELTPETKPIVGDIDIHYNYPQYSELGAKYQAFTTGHVKALVGSEVTLKTYPLVAAKSFEVVFDYEDGERVVTMERVTSNLVQTTFVLTQPASYRFRALMPDGKQLEDGIVRSIETEKDMPPELSITSHTGEVEVSPDDILELEFQAADDFGLEVVNYAYFFGSAENDITRTQVEMPELNNVPKTLTGTAAFDLAPLGLQPKDVVVVMIEATDNNALTGPGIGKSAPIVLRVASPEDRHDRVLAAQQEVLDALVDVLANFLESPIASRVQKKGTYRQKVRAKDLENVGTISTKFEPTHTSLGTVIEGMRQVSEMMRADPLMLKRDVQMFGSLENQLRRLHRDGGEKFDRLKAEVAQKRASNATMQNVANYAAESEDTLEKGILAFEALIASQKLDAIESSAAEIKKMKERLRELLQKYKETKDPELKKAILREVQRLRQRMGEMLTRMRSQIQQLPEEHLNTEAMKRAELESDTAKIGDGLQSIEDLLEKGDIDGAMAALDQMSTDIDSLTSDMKSQFDDARPEEVSELDKKLGDLMNDVNDLEQAQRSVEQQTTELQDEQSRERNKDLKALLEKHLQSIRKKIADQKRTINEIEDGEIPRHDARSVQSMKKQLSLLEQAVSSGDIEQALEHAETNRDDLKSVAFSFELSQRYAKKGSKKRKALRNGQSTLSKMAPKASEIANDLKELMGAAKNGSAQKNPQSKALGEKQKRIQKRAEKLREKIKQSSKQFPMLKDQLGAPIDSAKGKMEQSSEGLKQGKLQKSLDDQRAALDELGKLKQSMKESLQRERQGKKGRANEKVSIPKKDGRGRLDLRESLKDRMKEGRLERYQNEIERYYESLTE